MSSCSIFPKIDAVPKHRVQALLAAGWFDVAQRIGKEAFAKKADTTSRTIDNGITQNTLPETHTVFNSLVADPQALDPLLAEYGFRLCPLRADAANDLATAGGVIDAMGALVKARADGVRDHNETLAIAALLRPHMAAMTAIVREADEMRTGTG